MSKEFVTSQLDAYKTREGFISAITLLNVSHGFEGAEEHFLTFLEKRIPMLV